jgi:nucleotide-binding universal stress UspA family protein
MSFRTILTVTTPHRGNEDLEIVRTLAEGTGAHLSILVMALAAPPPVGEFGIVAPDVWLAGRQTDLDEIEARVKSLNDWLAKGGTPGDVTSDYPEPGSADEVIGRRARYADLTVIGPDLSSTGLVGEKAVEGALFSSGRPLLVVPEGSRPTLAPRRVMVAWDHRVEAARAAREALPLLAGAEAVHIVLVDPVQDDTAHGEEPGADAATWLARHGAKVSLDRIPSENRGVAATLARHATDCGAELIVMGAYGHSRLRERIFGGVTRTMLEAPPMPVLLAR